MKTAFREDGPLSDPSLEAGEQQARMALYWGAIGVFKNPSSHRQVDFDDPTLASEVILLADLLLRLDADASALRALLTSYWARETDLPTRVTRAIWRAELAAWTRWAEQMLALVVGALESLIATRAERLTKNFGRRLPMLATMVEFEGVDEALARRLYEARSQGVHGHRVDLLAEWEERAVDDVRLAYGLLRRTLRRLVEDDAFSCQFVDKSAIDRLFSPRRVSASAGTAAGPCP